MGDLRSYLAVAGVAVVLSYLLTPVVRYVSIRTGAIDHPTDRKVHAVPTPTLGGVAMLCGFLGGLAVASRLGVFKPLFISSDTVGIAVGGTLMVVIGVVDDVKGLTAPAKLAAQIFAAGVMTLLGVQVLSFWLPGVDVVALSPDLGVPLAVLIVVATVNAVNLVDGLDGLAAGLVAIAALAYFVYSYRSGTAGVTTANSPAALVGILIVGVCVGFLPHNFNPARIFMGDAGSMLLGTLLAGATVTGIGRTGAPGPGSQLAFLIPIAIPFFVLALPFLDTLFAIGRRMRAGQGVMTPDKNHIHHRLLEIGHSTRRAVLILYAWSALLAGSAVALSFTAARRVLPAFAVVLAFGIVLLLTPGRRLRRRRGAGV